MPTVTEIIKQELLDAMDEPAKLDAVVRKHSDSKGPFYHALAEATSIVTERFRKVAGDLSQTENRNRELTDQVRSKEQRVKELKGKEETLQQNINQSEARLSEQKELLDQADALAALRFGSHELSRLYEILAHISASQGVQTEEAVKTFFHTVEHYERIVSLELETKRAETKTAQAKADSKHWEAERRHKETESKARIATIDLVDTWLSKGIKEKDLPNWANILEKASVGIADFSNALNKYGSIEALCKERSQQANNLENLNKETQVRLNALKAQEAKVQTGIVAVRDKALQEMEKVSEQALRHINTFVSKAEAYGELQRRAAELEKELVVAKAFVSDDPQQWAEMPPQMAGRLVKGLTNWAMFHSQNQNINCPKFISQRLPGLTFAKMSIIDLLSWIAFGLLSEEERRQLETYS